MDKHGKGQGMIQRRSAAFSDNVDSSGPEADQCCTTTEQV